MLNVIRRMLRPSAKADDKHPYHPPTQPSLHLSRDSTARARMLAPLGGQRPPDQLYKIWQQIPGGHKWWHYFTTYEKILGPMRSRPIRFLEVGVYKGGSLEMWRQYFHPESTIVGIDIDPSCKTYDKPAKGMHVRIGDQSDVSFLRQVTDEFGPFDAIVDDGSHRCSHMIKTFDHLFLNGLTDCGTYITEDTHTNFWPDYRDQSYSFLDLCKDLVDLSHAHYFDHPGVTPFTINHPARITEVAVTQIGSQIEEIRFLDSIVVIQRRANRPLPTVEHL